MASELQVQMNRVAQQQHDTHVPRDRHPLRPPLDATLPVRGAHHGAGDLRRAPDRRSERRQRLLEARHSAQLSGSAPVGPHDPRQGAGPRGPARRALRWPRVAEPSCSPRLARRGDLPRRDQAHGRPRHRQPRRGRGGRALGGRLVRRAADVVRGDGRRATGGPQPPVRPRQGAEPRRARRDPAARRCGGLDRGDRDRSLQRERGRSARRRHRHRPDGLRAGSRCLPLR